MNPDPEVPPTEPKLKGVGFAPCEAAVAVAAPNRGAAGCPKANPPGVAVVVPLAGEKRELAVVVAAPNEVNDIIIRTAGNQITYRITHYFEKEKSLLTIKLCSVKHEPLPNKK